MDTNSFSTMLLLLQNEGYLIMLLIMIFEGPIITSVAAFAASLGYFNIYYILILSVLGNLLGDLFYYSIGRFGRKAVVDRYFEKFGIGIKLIKKLEKHLELHPWKILTIIKVIPPLPTPGLILAGASNMNLKKFIIFTGTISFFFSLFFALMGYYLGAIFYRIFGYTIYLQWGVLGVIACTIIITLIYKKYAKKIYEKLSRY